MTITHKLEAMKDLRGPELENALAQIEPTELKGFLEQQYRETHASLKNASPETFKSVPQGALDKLGDLGVNTEAVDIQKMEAVASLARSTSEDDFVDYMLSGEMPPIELSDVELEMLRGGGWPILIASVASTAIPGAGEVAALCCIGSIVWDAVQSEGGGKKKNRGGAKNAPGSIG